MNTIVTVTNENPTNQAALKFLIHGLRQHSPLNTNINVLSPSNTLDRALTTWLRSNNVVCHEYKLVPNGDTYQVKFLLANFIRNNATLENILYLDPDHIILGDISSIPPATTGTLYVSSEISYIENNALNNLPNIDHDSIHYNTSFIYGHRQDWLTILDDWIAIYSSLEQVIPNRFREEIAFSLAARPSGIRLFPTETRTQAYFKNNNNNCTIFHYGGNYIEAKRVKECLNSETAILERLRALLAKPSSEIESWIVTKLINIHEALL